MCLPFNFAKSNGGGDFLEISSIHNVENIFRDTNFALLCQPARDLHK